MAEVVNALGEGGGACVSAAAFGFCGTRPVSKPAVGLPALDHPTVMQAGAIFVCSLYVLTTNKRRLDIAAALF
jgi:hypothetical protein